LGTLPANPASGLALGAIDHAAIYDAALKADRVPSAVDYMDRLPWFQKTVDWTPWRVFVKAVYALPMTAEELAIFRKHTGRRWPPVRPVQEVWAAVGRRGMKTSILGLLAFYQSICRDYSEHLAERETAWSVTISTNMGDALKIHENVDAILNCHQLAHFRHGKGKVGSIPLRVGVEVKARANKITAGRGRAIVFAGLDEIGFYRTKGAAIPDEEVLRGIRPAMANVEGALLAAMSSPYAMRGELYRAYEDYFGQDVEDYLFWMADTISMHDTPRIRAFVAKEYAKDAVSAASEFGTPEDGIKFREDVLLFVSPAVVKAATVAGRQELAPCSMRPAKGNESEPRRFHYFAFVDVSGGSSDAYTLAVAHWDREIPHLDATGQPKTQQALDAKGEPRVDPDGRAIMAPVKGKAVLDYVRAWAAPFNPKAVTREAAQDVKRYHLVWVTGDAYAGLWPSTEWADHGIGYHVSEKDKHHIYKDALPTLNSGFVELLDRESTNAQIKDLDRRVTPTGQERIDHKPGGHDDEANAALGALELAYRLGPWQDDPQVAREITTTNEIIEREMREMEGDQGGADRAEGFYDRYGF
jgi:hypothetical protein